MDEVKIGDIIICTHNLNDDFSKDKKYFVYNMDDEDNILILSDRNDTIWLPTDFQGNYFKIGIGISQYEKMILKNKIESSENNKWEDYLEEPEPEYYDEDRDNDEDR